MSVIIPTIPSRKKELERAIKSVKQQTYKNVEIIVVSEGINSAEARNIGIEKANGDFIAFLDDDDEWLPTKLEKQVKLFNQDTLLVGCWIEDRRFYKPYILKSEEKVYIKELLENFNFLSTSSYIFNAKWLKHNLFDTNFPSAQEYELAIRACKAFPVKCYPEVLVIQHKSADQITKNWKAKKLGLKLLLKKHKTRYRGFGLWNYIVFRIKFLGLQCIYSLAQILGERIYKIILPLKMK